MAADLTGLTPGGTDATYKWLAHFGVQGALPADGGTPVVLYKGDGTATPISLTATKLFVNGIEVNAPLNKLDATVAPTVDDDVTLGYSVGSKWYDLTAGEAYLCFDATDGAAIWEKATLTADELGDAAFKNTGTTAGTVAAGDDARLSDERVPTAAGLTSKFGTAKTPIVDADKATILDSAASDVPKHATFSTIWTWIQSKFAGASSKTTPIDADSFVIVDSADSNAAKRVTGTNLKEYLRVKTDGTAFVAGDLTGDTRGSGSSLDIQSLRSVSTQVTSGSSSVAIGRANTSSGTNGFTAGNTNTASGTRSNAVGFTNTSSGQDSCAIGSENTASTTASQSLGRLNYSGTGNAVFSVGGLNNQTGATLGLAGTVSGTPVAVTTGRRSSAFGYLNKTTGNDSCAFGSENTAGGADSVAYGRRVTTSVANTAEFGYWSSTTIRSATCRMQSDGQVAFTIRDSASPPTDGGATAGSEANGTLGRGMFTIQKNGNDVTLYFNNAGTIQSLSLGTLA